MYFSPTISMYQGTQIAFKNALFLTDVTFYVTEKPFLGSCNKICMYVCMYVFLG